MIRFKIDKESTDKVDKLTSLFGFKKDTITLRICFASSLLTNYRFTGDETEMNSNGREYTPTSNVFGNIVNGNDNYIVYKSILETHYKREFSEPEFIKYFKLHLKQGIDKVSEITLKSNITRGAHINYIMKLVKSGLDLQSNTINLHTNYSNKFTLQDYSNPLSFILGESENGDLVNIRINDLKQFDNRNIAIAGMAGSGKTQLIKDVLFQISKNTENKLKFIFFDYKGEGNSEQLRPFLEPTNCEFIDILKDGLNFNPLTSINLNEGERQRTFSIKAFVETVATFIPSIGVSQKNTLQTVITELIEEKNNQYPNLTELYERLAEYYDTSKIKPDTLYSGIKDLASGLFSDDISEDIIGKSIYLNLPPTLSDTLRQLCVFLLLRYFNFFFSSTNDAEPTDDIMPLRYVIVIDEAHVYLKNKNARKALEDLLRLLRSKGVIVIMLSQGVEDYKTKDFDFASQVKLPICLNIQNKDPKLIKTFVGTPRSEHKLNSEINKLKSGLGLINIDEPKIIKLRQFWKTMSQP